MVAGQSGEKILAVIPARGGSKRLPGKNIIDFYGKPMISYVIKAALDTQRFDEVLVSTDDEEIAEIARSAGALVPFLRNAGTDDYASASEATLAALHQMEDHTGKKYDVVVQLMANCPLRGADCIQLQLDAFLQQEESYSLLSGFQFGMANPWWAHKLHEDGSVSRLFPEEISHQRSQDLPKLLCPTGATWISDRDALVEHENFYSPHYRLHEISWIEAVDIDEEDDLLLAKAAYQIQNQTREAHD